MFNIIRRELEWGGRPLLLETGRLARQADGAVLVNYGDTSVLAAAVAAREPRPDADFFPLTVHYQEKYFAAGKIPGGFFKREARPSEKEVLTSRLIDRPIRPLFPKGYRNEVQIIATVLSHDLENDPDIVAMVGVSAALAVAGAPFGGPVGGARVGFADGGYTLNPPMSDLPDSRLDLVVAGTESAVMMVESEADELSEEEMLGAVVFGHREMQPVIQAIRSLAEEAGAEPAAFEPPDIGEVRARVAEVAEEAVGEAAAIVDKRERRERLAEILATVREKVGEEEAAAAAKCLAEIERDVVRGRIVREGRRIDGRALDAVRPIACTVGELPRTHGSAVFTRGETQALVVTTLGTGEDEQIMDTLHLNYRERFLLHYNFPPYSVGETRRVGPPGRREIGHGKLAWRALRPLLPPAEEFPYTLRVVSEVLESNGSSSMATVCGASLSMMDAGVPLRRPVAGIAMGLILEGGEFAVLTDILGDEDHLGDMDFKVAGTEEGVTSLQMDIKVDGITEEIMRAALDQARGARMHILGEMANALSSGREEFSRYAPRIEIVTIPVSRIRDVIGTGGKVIRAIVEETGAKINVDDDGVVKISSSSQEQIAAARQRVVELTSDPEEGRVYEGTVVKLMEFGAFVNFFGAKDGLVHVSQMANYRVRSPADIVSEGQKVRVRFTGMDDRGKFSLTMKGVSQEPDSPEGADSPPERARPARRKATPAPAAGADDPDGPGDREELDGVVRDVRPFGALVELAGGRMGLVHRSELSGALDGRVSDIVERGQKVRVRHAGVDERGRARLSMRGVEQPEGRVRREPAENPDRDGGEAMEPPGDRPRADRPTTGEDGYFDDDLMEEPLPGSSVHGRGSGTDYDDEELEDDYDLDMHEVPHGGLDEEEAPEEGRSYEGVVTTVQDYGAFVRFLGRHEALVHVSNMPGRQIGDTQPGDRVKVWHTGVDRRGRVQLSMSDPDAPPPWAKLKKGRVYDGEVVKKQVYGVFVRFEGDCEALVHVSNMDCRLVNLDLGQRVKVLYTGLDDLNRIQLSMKGVDQVTGERTAGETDGVMKILSSGRGEGVPRRRRRDDWGARGYDD